MRARKLFRCICGRSDLVVGYVWYSESRICFFFGFIVMLSSMLACLLTFSGGSISIG